MRKGEDVLANTAFAGVVSGIPALRKYSIAKQLATVLLNEASSNQVCEVACPTAMFCREFGPVVMQICAA
ncbi:hypothetical protein D3C87_1305560 [compost metagenome]